MYDFNSKQPYIAYICAVESGNRNCLAQLGKGEGGGGGGGGGGRLQHHQDHVLELDKLSQLFAFYAGLQ